MDICPLGKQKGWLWKNKGHREVTKLSPKLTKICRQSWRRFVHKETTAEFQVLEVRDNEWIRCDGEFEILSSSWSSPCWKHSNSMQWQAHCRRRRTPAPCGSTTSMQAATSIRSTGQKSAPKSFWRQYVNNVWKWQEVKSRVEMIIWKISTVENDKLEDVMKMAIS